MLSITRKRVDMSPFGRHWKERNQFQAYYLEMIKAIEGDDLGYFEQLKDELLESENGLEKFLYIWRHMSSSTRAKVPKGE